MLDLDAPIVPGEGAAGLRVGARVADLPPTALASFAVERRVNPCLPNAVLTVYRSPAVTLTVENRVIDQIAVHGGYRGALAGDVRVGCSLAEAEARLGPVAADDLGQLVVRDLPGLRFEVADPVPVAVPAGDVSDDEAVSPSAPITAIVVFRT